MARAAGPQARPQPPTESAVPNTAGNADVQGLGREAAARAGAVGTGGFGSGKTSEDWLFASKPTPATFLAGHPGFAPEDRQCPHDPALAQDPADFDEFGFTTKEEELMSVPTWLEALRHNKIR
ncbi:unnamed protein product [Prorocentrum cordatum]|uniref:Uncharacterized protein n=1 Tax=Prorocentrum cordatum TaxID=2364126 RepID=A0ABN9SV22_9DINO|nr:unnamed protein product [Polarella glacialis]